MVASTAVTLSIGDLPDEVLLQILQCFRASSSLSEFTSVLLVNKKFYKVGQSVAFELLALTNKNFDGFYESAKYIGEQYKGVHHLTVTLEHDYHGICQFRDCECRFSCATFCGGQCVGTHGDVENPKVNGHVLFRRLQRLTWILRTKLPQLQSLALIINPQPSDEEWCPCYESESCAEGLIDILYALPPTCKSLMLDTGGTENHEELVKSENSSKTACRLCKAIRNSMFSLEHLKLKCPELCLWFLVQDECWPTNASYYFSAFEAWFEEEGRAIYNEEHDDYGDFRLESHEKQWKMWSHRSQETRQVSSNASRALVLLLFYPCPILVLSIFYSRAFYGLSSRYSWSTLDSLSICSGFILVMSISA